MKGVTVHYQEAPGKSGAARAIREVVANQTRGEKKPGKESKENGKILGEKKTRYVFEGKLRNICSGREKQKRFSKKKEKHHQDPLALKKGIVPFRGWRKKKKEKKKKKKTLKKSSQHLKGQRGDRTPRESLTKRAAGGGGVEKDHQHKTGGKGAKLANGKHESSPKEELEGTVPRGAEGKKRGRSRGNRAKRVSRKKIS